MRSRRSGSGGDSHRAFEPTTASEPTKSEPTQSEHRQLPRPPTGGAIPHHPSVGNSRTDLNPSCRRTTPTGRAPVSCAHVRLRIPSSRRHMWLVVLIVGVALLVLTRQACLLTGNPHLWPAYLLVGALILPATVVSFVDGMSTTFMVAPVHLIVIATVGGVLGVVLAGLGEFGLQNVYGELPRIAVAVVEEASKLIIPLVALLLVRRDAANGLIIGMASGGGFAVVETLGYTGAAFVHAGTTLSEVDNLLWERAIFTPATHIAWTGLATCALGFAFERRWSLIAISGFVGAFGFAVLLHTLWDASNTGGYLILSAVSIGAICGVAYLLGVPNAGHESQSPDRDR